MLDRGFVPEEKRADKRPTIKESAGLMRREGALSRDDVMLYLAALAIIIIGVWGVWLALDNAPIGIIMLAFALTGFGSSLWLRKRNEPLYASLIFVGGVVVLLALLSLAGIDFVGAAAPGIAALSESTLSSVALIGIVLTIVSFLLVNRQALAFSVIPVLAIFGLIATLLEAKVIIAFLVYLLASVFLLGYEHILSLKDMFNLRLPRAEAKQLPRSQLLISAGFMAGVLVMGLAISLLLTATLSGATMQGLLDALSGIPQFDPEVFTPRTNTGRNQATPDADTQFRVGLGPVSLSQEIVMYVKADAGELWRQRAYDLYTGRGWSVAGDAESSRTTLKQGKATLPEYAPEVPREGRVVRQTFRMQRSLQVGIPAASQPFRVDFGAKNPQKYVEVDRFGCLVTTNQRIAAGQTYKITSLTPNFNSANREIALEEEERERYLQLPFEARKVRNLTEDILARYPDTSDYGRLNALQAYLQGGNYRYTLDPRPVPRDEDAATYFLFESKEGYCDLFATSFALMARAAGIPSRVAVGFQTGSADPESGEYVVRVADGHAWVEVFLEGRGWVTVDATPAGDPEVAAEKGPSWLSRFKLPASGTVMLVIALGLLVTAGVAKVLLVDPWLRRVRWEKRLWQDMRGRMLVIYTRMCRLFEKKGLTRAPSQTPLEYLAELAEKEGYLGEALRPAGEITDLFIATRYGEVAADPQRVAAAQQALRQLKEKLPRRKPKAEPADKGK